MSQVEESKLAKQVMQWKASLGSEKGRRFSKRWLDKQKNRYMEKEGGEGLSLIHI